MSNVIQLEADTIDEAICVSMIYFGSSAPIAVYNTEEKPAIKFPYDPEVIDKIVGGMGERVKVSYASIKK